MPRRWIRVTRSHSFQLEFARRQGALQDAGAGHQHGRRPALSMQRIRNCLHGILVADVERHELDAYRGGGAGAVGGPIGDRDARARRLEGLGAGEPDAACTTGDQRAGSA